MDDLVKRALAARKFAQANRSNFAVGAAVEAGGKIFTGINVESSSYGLTICAERVALAKALSEGETEITKISVIADTEEPVSPCGACRQLLLDYAPEADIIMANIKGKTKTMKVRDLLPYAFTEKDLKR